MPVKFELERIVGRQWSVQSNVLPGAVALGGAPCLCGTILGIAVDGNPLRQVVGRFADDAGNAGFVNIGGEADDDDPESVGAVVCIDDLFRPADGSFRRSGVDIDDILSAVLPVVAAGATIGRAGSFL
ncbi:hypothetical protein ACQ86N_09985 [Puia sp. P3]|uniref:hypothetical protein n=1 Tax=Puia sp. P3 TaxID=3423952 RepID=UPI003D665C96